MKLLVTLLCAILVNGQHQYQSVYSNGLDYTGQAAAQQYASAYSQSAYQPTDYGQQQQIVASQTAAVQPDYTQAQYPGQQQQQQQQQLQYPYQPAYPSPYAPQPAPAPQQQSQVQIDQKNVQRYAQYLDILQKSYGIQVPKPQVISSPYTTNQVQPAQPAPQPTAYPGAYSQQKSVYPSYPTVAQPAPQAPKSPYTIFPAGQGQIDVQSPYTYAKPAEIQSPYTYTKPTEIQSPYTYSKPEAPSPYTYTKPEVAYPQPARQVQPTIVQQRPYVPQAPSTAAPQPVQQPTYIPGPIPHPQPYVPAPAAQTYVPTPQVQQRPSPEDEYSRVYPSNQQSIENVIPQQPAGYPYQQSKIEMPEQPDYSSNSVVEAPVVRPAPPPEKPQPNRNSLTVGEQPQSVASATSVQALTQQIRRLPAVLYVDSRDPQAKRTENQLRETYGLPLVAFYIDKIDDPKAVEKNLKHLTAHEGLPYLFICGTFIGSQQHIDNYHNNKQIPQLVEYVCGDEKKRKKST